MKKFLILSLVSLSLFYFVSCKGEETVKTTPATTGTEETSGTGTPGTKIMGDSIQYADNVSVEANDPISGVNCENKGLDNKYFITSQTNYNQVFKVDSTGKKYTYIGVYNTGNGKVIVDGNKKINGPFNKLGFLYGSFEGKIQVTGINDLKDAKNGDNRANTENLTDYGDLFALKNKVTGIGLKRYANQVCDFTYEATKINNP